MTFDPNHPDKILAENERSKDIESQARLTLNQACNTLVFLSQNSHLELDDKRQLEKLEARLNMLRTALLKSEASTAGNGMKQPMDGKLMKLEKENGQGEAVSEKPPVIHLVVKYKDTERPDGLIDMNIDAAGYAQGIWREYIDLPHVREVSLRWVL